MSTTTFELTDFTAPAYLHFNNEKFWEIKLKQESNETIVRCGKLTGKDEDSGTLQTLTKSHPNLGESITYMEKHVNLKLSKGYRFLKKEAPPVFDSEPRVVQRETSRTTAWSINIIPPSLERSNSDFDHRRRREDDLVREDLKQTKYENTNSNNHYDRNNDYSNHATNHSNHANDNGNDYSRHSGGFQETGDADLDEAIALSIIEDARRKKLEKMRADKGDITMLSYNSSNNGNSQRDRDNGYSNSNSQPTSSFQGEYLTLENHRGVQFFKIQVLKKHLKIEKGTEGRNPEKEFQICHDNNDAITQARRQITELISKGYKTKSHKFDFDFTENELNFQRNSHHTVPRSAPASRGASPDDSRDNTNNGRYKDAYNDTSGVFDRLDVGDNDEDDYSNTSRRSAYWDLDEEEKETGRSTRGRSNSVSRGAVSDNGRDDDDDEDDEDFVGESVDLGPDPLGKPISKNYTSVLLAHKWENEDPTGWYMSEKLDGVRCFWNGRTMWSRNNKQYFPPKWFVKDFPKSPLDGELWTGRSTFQKCVSVVRKQTPIDSEWKNVKYMVFDAPELKQPFRDRIKKMKEVFSKIKSPYIGLLDHRICKSRSELNEELAVVQNLGGEGLMIRNPNSHYECRRSRTLLKVKTFDDDEATIIGHEPGSGKYIGMCGALRCRNGAGIEFSVGSGLNDAMRAKPPKIGVKITYKHQGVSNRGVPRFPTFLRLYQGN